VPLIFNAFIVVTFFTPGIAHYLLSVVCFTLVLPVPHYKAVVLCLWYLIVPDVCVSLMVICTLV